MQSIAHISDRVGTRDLDTGLGSIPTLPPREERQQKKWALPRVQMMSAWWMNNGKMPNFITRKMQIKIAGPPTPVRKTTNKIKHACTLAWWHTPIIPILGKRKRISTPA